MRHLVVGTAGHIDHGKSALVLRLTGTDPDRLAEEKRRGITIDLGFADLELDGERVVSIVDVPGHERFVRHMVAGATGIDAVLLVVAADQGIQPQTREHLAICALLGLERGVVALTKADLVDPETREVAALELRELLEGTFLENSPLVAVSSKTGDGFDRLRDELARLFDLVPERPQAGAARLPVDRSFTLKGFGTVVTGTLASGVLREGDEVEILPDRRKGRIRGLQVHGASVRTVAAGSRAAVNLQGLDCADVPRGATVASPGRLLTTRRIWARLTLLPDAPDRLARGGDVRFHQGTCERAARVRIVGRDDGGELLAEIRLDDETVLVPGDRFIVRRPAPVDTVGGGVVVDVRPPRSRRASPEDFAGPADDDGAAIHLRLHRAGAAGLEPARLAGELGRTEKELEDALASLPESGAVVRCGSRWFDATVWSGLRAAVGAEIERFHRDERLAAGISREELRARIVPELAQDSWRGLLESMEQAGEVELKGETVARAGHEVVLSEGDRGIAERLESALREGWLEPPDANSVLGDVEERRRRTITDLLIARGVVVRIRDGKLFHSDALRDLRGRLIEYARESGTIDVRGFKDLAGLTRKHAIPLLEHLDAERWTRRSGNEREILLGR